MCINISSYINEIVRSGRAVAKPTPDNDVLSHPQLTNNDVGKACGVWSVGRWI